MRELINYVPREYSKDEFKKEFFNSEKDSTLSADFAEALKYFVLKKATLKATPKFSAKTLMRECVKFGDAGTHFLNENVFYYDLPNSDFVTTYANGQFYLKFDAIEQAIKNYDNNGNIPMDFDIDQLETKDIAPMIKEIVDSENKENNIQQTNNSQDESTRQDEINS